ncbi:MULTISPECIES: TRAP transporter small permease [Pacificibacter]|uniref:TRAP transporter small permease n=1 Tax=Pacificibacter TaxID=1042323 RepID=UPI001C09E49B|nr:TRAP transporter small permease [Pacificibacter sp. 1_MG-2023]MBU2936331.1 TRAP transporter small permease [Pacificibacter marinus]MDO6616631.1 TRAP transporter small permease [Pacificibacter sp. 1_MG-2023]
MKKSMNWAMHIFGAASAAGFAGIAIVVCADVLIRNLALAQLSWISEFIGYLMMLSTFLGAPWLLYAHGHVQVDILPRLLSPTNASRLAIVANVAGLAITGLLFWRTCLVTLDTWQLGSLVFKNLIFPEWYLLLPILICLGMCCLEFIFRLTVKGYAQ